VRILGNYRGKQKRIDMLEIDLRVFPVGTFIKELPWVKRGLIKGRCVDAMFPETRSLVLFLTRLMVTVLLFVQAALAADACRMPSTNPAMAFDSDVVSRLASRHKSANACLSQCLQVSQALDTQFVPVVAAKPSSPVLAVAREVVSLSPLWEPELLNRATSPPVSIKFRVFRS
jgi:hypothetical protein